MLAWKGRLVYRCRLPWPQGGVVDSCKYHLCVFVRGFQGPRIPSSSEREVPDLHCIRHARASYVVQVLRSPRRVATARIRGGFGMVRSNSVRNRGADIKVLSSANRHAEAELLGPQGLS